MDAPFGTVWNSLEKAWMCDFLCEEWFKGVFLKNCGPARPQLLIPDSHGSHEVIGLLEEAKKNKKKNNNREYSYFSITATYHPLRTSLR
jgi:hypothetical protein